MSDQTFDFIVVGAGSAGAALAARLSETETRTVLLLEAGADYRTTEEYPRELAMASSMAATIPGHPSNWDFVGELTPGRTFPLARGKVLGGSSTINGTYFIRAPREDFDVWAADGNDLWSYDQVLPYFKKSETDLDFDGPYHGTSGPIPVARVPEDKLHAVSKAFIEACVNAGFPDEPDKNVPGPEGVGRVPRNVRDGIRMNTGITYLAPVRSRRNLAIQGGTLVTKVLIAGNRAVGVEAIRAGKKVVYRAGEVILSAGALKTPHLLMLSGIGPADHLRAHGIDVIHDGPGVGRNVKDHPVVMLPFRVRDDKAPIPAELQPFETTLNYTAPGSNTNSDVHLLCGVLTFRQMTNARDANGRASRIPAYMKRPVATLKAVSKLQARTVVEQMRRQDDLSMLVGLEAGKSVGEILLASGDPTQLPEVHLNYLSDPADLPRLCDNLRVAVELLSSPSFKALGAKVIAPTSPALSSDIELGRWIRASLGSAFHSINSAHMGPASDPMAVVDQHCRVYGVDGLRIADLSIVPSMRRGPAATAVMIGERVAGLINGDGQPGS